MMDRVRNCCGQTRESDFAHSTRSERIEVEVRVVEECHVNLRAVRMNRNDVFCEIVANRRAATLVVLSGFQHGHADSHHNSAFDLVLSGAWIQHASSVYHGDNAADPEPGDVGSKGLTGRCFASGRM